MASCNFIGIAMAIMPRLATALIVPAPEPSIIARLATQTDPAAQLSSLDGLRLGKRMATESSTTTYTVTVAPDETCGYLSGSAGAPITCEGGETCFWEAGLSVMGCGWSTAMTMYDSCYEMTEALNTTICNDVCQSNEFHLLCTETSAAYCRTFAYPGDISDYRCVSAPQTRISRVAFTYDGEVNSFTTTTLSGSSSAPIETYRPSTTYVRPPIETAPATSAATTSAVPSSKTPIGAIVGGVVGGLAVIGLVLLGAIFLLRRRKGQQAPPPAPPVQPQQQQQQPETQFQPPGQFQPIAQFKQEPVPQHPQHYPSPAGMSDAKTAMGESPYSPPVSPMIQSPTIGSPAQSDWRTSSIVSPQSTGAQFHPTGAHNAPAELGTAPPGHSNSVHELQ